MSEKEASVQPVHMLYERDLLLRIDDFRFEHRFASRTEAIKWLLKWALDHKPKVPRSS
jgi:hypothetical protein